MIDFYSFKRYTGDGSKTDFAVPFEYLERNHVTVKVNGQEVTSVAYSWLSDYEIRFNYPPAEAARIDIRRNTPRDSREVVYQDGSSLNARQMNTISKQLLYLNQELWDDLRGALSGLNPGDLEGIVPDGDTQNDIIAEIAAKLADSQLYDEFQTQVENFEQTVESVLNNEALLGSVQSDVQAVDSLMEQMGEISIEGFLRESDRWEQAREQDSRLVTVNTRVDNAESNITTLEITQADQATRISAVESEVDLDGDGTADVASRVIGVESTQTDQGEELSTQASRIDTLESEIGVDGGDGETLTARVESVETTQVSQGDTLDSQAARISTIESEIDTDGDGTADIAATVGTIEDTQASQGDELNAQATRIEATEAELDLDGDGNLDASVKIQENQTAVASHDGEIADLEGKYTVKVDVNGRVAGFGLAQYENDDTGNLVSDFYVTSDRFAVIDPSDGDVKVGWDGSIFIIDGSLIVDDSITANQFNVSYLSAITADLGTVNAGLFKTAGSGSRVEMEGGASLPLWYGSGSKTKSNGTFYVDDSGAAFFGGSVSIGDGAGGGTGLSIQDDKIVVRDSSGAVRVKLGKLS